MIVLTTFLFLAVGILLFDLLVRRKAFSQTTQELEDCLHAGEARLGSAVAGQKTAQQAMVSAQRRLSLLAQIRSTVAGEAPLLEEGPRLAERIALAFDADACVIRVVEGRNLVFLASFGMAEKLIPPSLPANWGVYREIMSRRRPVFVRDLRSQTAMMPFASPATGEPRFNSSANAPMVAQDQIMGVLDLYTGDEKFSFSETDLEHLQIVANHIAAGIVNDRLFREIQSQKDQLTRQVKERQRAEAALRQSEERFRMAAEYFPYAFVIYDAQRRLRFVNARGLQLCGRSHQSLVGRRDEEWLPPEVTRHYLPALQRAIDTRSHQTVEGTVPLPAGSFTIVAHFVPLLDEHGGIRQILGIAHDITERKRAEEALKQSEGLFRAISEQSMMGIYIMQDGKFSYVNPKFAEIHGYTQAEMLLLPSVFDIVTEEDRELVAENMYRRLAGEFPALHYRAHGRRKDGKVITIEIHGIRTELNGKGAVIGTLQDITERERDESALKRTTEQLQGLSQRLLELQEAERRHIARELHDEIGQALTALKINLQALQQPPTANDDFVTRLADSVDIVDRTLRQVRNLALNLRPSMLDDLGLSAALRWYADQQAQRAGLRVQFLAPATESRLNPNLETACFRVAQEALTNIVRHAQANQVRVELAHGDGCLHLIVKDDGVGFDLNAVRRKPAHRRSMGLLGMEERVLLAGGSIEVTSMPRFGTEVHASFPLVNEGWQPSPKTDLTLQ